MRVIRVIHDIQVRITNLLPKINFFHRVMSVMRVMHVRRGKCLDTFYPTICYLCTVLVICVMHVIHVMWQNPFYHIKFTLSVMLVAQDIYVRRAKCS